MCHIFSLLRFFARSHKDRLCELQETDHRARAMRQHPVPSGTAVPRMLCPPELRFLLSNCPEIDLEWFSIL